MKKVLILGANGRITRLVVNDLLNEGVDQRLFLRHAYRVHVKDENKQMVIKGDS